METPPPARGRHQARGLENAPGDHHDPDSFALPFADRSRRGAALVTLAGVQIHSASATKREASIAPAVVGVVDMEKLFGNLKELKDENGKLDGIAKQRKAEIETKEEAAQGEGEALTELPNDQVDQHRQLEQELYEENERFKVKVALSASV